MVVDKYLEKPLRNLAKLLDSGSYLVELFEVGSYLVKQLQAGSCLEKQLDSGSYLVKLLEAASYLVVYSNDLHVKLTEDDCQTDCQGNEALVESCDLLRFAN